MIKEDSANLNRLKSALAVSNIAVWEWDAKSGEIFWDDLAYTMLGFEPQSFEINYEKWRLMLHPDDLALAESSFKKQISASDIFINEFRYRKNDGGWLWIEGCGKIVERDEDGNPKRLVGTHKDISKRKEYELKLKESELFFRTLIETLPDLVWIKDEDGIYLHCNKRFEDFYGHKVEEIVGKSDYDFAPKELADFFRMYDKKAIELKGAPSVNEEEITFASDGHKEYLETVKKAIFTGDGRLIGVLGVGRDITVRKKTENMLKDFGDALAQAVEDEVKSRLDAQRVYASIFEHSPLGVLVLSSDFKFSHANKSALNAIGYTLDELVGKSPLCISPEIQPETSLFSEAAAKEIMDSVKNGEFRNFEWTHIHKDGHEVLFDVTVTQSGLRGGDCLVFWRDITETRRLQDEKRLQEALLVQQSKLAEMGEMIGAIAHQWKQPLNIISLLNSSIPDLIEYNEVTEEKLTDVHNGIKKQVQFMNQTVDDFRRFLMPDREKIRFVACSAIEEMMSILSHQFKKDGIAITIHPHEHFFVFGYPNELKQVFLNLFKNSRDAFDGQKDKHKSINIYISNDGRMGKIVVCDNAGGIPGHLLPNRLFEKYVSTKGDKGTGIGLQLTKKIIVEHFNGKISAYNSQDGACFEIQLPIV